MSSEEFGLNMMVILRVLQCDKEKISHLIFDHSDEPFNITIIDINMEDPDNYTRSCMITNVNNCYVVYPSNPWVTFLSLGRLILIIMYIMCAVITVSVCIIYGMRSRKQKTLPVVENAKVPFPFSQELQGNSQTAQLMKPSPSPEQPTESTLSPKIMTLEAAVVAAATDEVNKQ